MPNSSYPDPIDSNAWYPSGDHSSSLVYQGSFTLPDYCHGGQVRLKSGGTFLTGIMSSDHTDKVSVRWHYSANGSNGGWGATSSIVPNAG